MGRLSHRDKETEAALREANSVLQRNRPSVGGREIGGAFFFVACMAASLAMYLLR